MLVPQPSILFIDAYDSFTNNIISLLTTTLSCSVRVVHIDSLVFESDEILHNELRRYDAVVCGPGPGDPANEKDVGLMNRIWRLSDDNIIPVLGICLGFQSLAIAFGGQIKILPEGLHGIVKRIRYVGENRQEPKSELFHGIGEVWATLYHSLYVDLGQDSMPVSEWERKRWDDFQGCADLKALAWVHPVSKADFERTGMKNGPILTAVQHKTKPFYGLQYHPESICTNKESRKIIRNWFAVAQRWNRGNMRIPCRDKFDVKGELPIRRSLLGEVHVLKTEKLNFENRNFWDIPNSEYDYESNIVKLPSDVTVPDLLYATMSTNKDSIVLESSNCHTQGKGAQDVRGRYSIIGLEVDKAIQIEYQVNSSCAVIKHPWNGREFTDRKYAISLKSYGGIWQFVAQYLEDRRVDRAGKDIPFLGGFVGYTTYELGLEGINVESGFKTRRREKKHPDFCFAWITRSMVIDHKENKIHIQHLVDRDAKGEAKWLESFTASLRAILSDIGSTVTSVSKGLSTNDLHSQQSRKPMIITPNGDMYESKVRLCQENIRRGDSYELCLTDGAHVTIPKGSRTTWDLYQTLRSRQQAPFASFIRLGAATFISSSPERFLTWSSNGLCSLRPMKGTIRKSSAVSTISQATTLLNVPKERAENLMIVDLVRHDLHSVCGPGNVTVPRLMVVEEYTSVFQMVSIVEGQIRPPLVADSTTTVAEASLAWKTRHTGIDVLAASLPPGSMTGAPKKRSCELLSDIEGEQERSLYSGVVGYIDVGGRGDFSVNIRCMFRWDDEISHRFNEHGVLEEMETWHIGAGGAVTGLSEARAEREEMQTKLAGTLGVFGVAVEATNWDCLAEVD